MRNWQETTLRDLVGSPISGSRPSGGVREDTEGVPSIGGENVLAEGGMTYEVLKKIPHQFYAQMGKGKLRSGDVLINKDGAQTGKVALYEGEFDHAAVNEHLFILRPSNGKIDERFLYYSLLRRETKAAISRQITGSAQPGLASTFVDHVRVNLPTPLDEQRFIARILLTLDVAIHDTHSSITKLKAIKRGLLHDLLTRGIDANGELRPTQSEAPHLFKGSSVGWIPKDWGFGALQTWLDGKPTNGHSPQEAGEWTGIQMLGLGCLTPEGFEPVQLKAAPRGDRRLAAAILSDGDLLMSRSNTRDLVGLVGVYRDVGTPCSFPDLMMRLRASPATSSEFLQFVLRSSAVRRQIQAHAVGTSASMVKISGRIVCGLEIAIPPKPEQERILSCLATGDLRLQAEAEKALVLRDLKAGLMDDLLTGRVRVTQLLAAEPKGSA